MIEKDKEIKAYSIRYKHRSVIKGGVIRASSKDRAERIGRQWCNEHEAALFLEVYDPAIAEELPDGTVLGIEDQTKLGFK